MEELGRTSRLARRLALAAMICCTASTGNAADPPAGESTQANSFRSLLEKGWSATKSLESIESPVPHSQVASSSAATDLSVAEADRNAEIVRPKLRLLGVPEAELATELPAARIAPPIKAADVKPEVAAHQSKSAQSVVSPPTKQEKATTPATSSSLAELIHRRTKPLQVPVLPQDSDAIQFEFVPSVNRLDVERQTIAIAARQTEESAANVQLVTPIITEAEIAESVECEAESTAPAIASDVPTNANSAESSGDAPATSVIAKSAPTEASIDQTQLQSSEEPTKVVAPTPAVASEVAATVPSDRSRRVASDNGFGLLPLESFDSDAAVELGSQRDEVSLTTTIHSTRLRELAQESLRSSSHRMQRRATHSAKKYAVEALRSIVAMRDAEAGGNQHAQELDVALDAIRESDDFCGRFGPIDQNALRRMVVVHETDVLKGQDLEDMSALEATEKYLAVARTNLIAAAGGVREASDALVLLGQIEKQLSAPGDTHGAAVAVTLQRAAIDIAPTNGPGYRELGTTLLDQGLVKQAAWALSRSVEIQPTRSGYQGLLEASRRLGDVDTARLCLASLQDPNVADEIPVKELSPDVFAATYKPNLSELKNVPAKTQPPAVTAPPASETRISLRSLFPFGRR